MSGYAHSPGRTGDSMPVCLWWRSPSSSLLLIVNDYYLLFCATWHVCISGPCILQPEYHSLSKYAFPRNNKIRSLLFCREGKKKKAYVHCMHDIGPVERAHSIYANRLLVGRFRAWRTQTQTYIIFVLLITTDSINNTLSSLLYGHQDKEWRIKRLPSDAESAV